METRPFGRTGLTVPALGLGAGPLGDHHLSEGDAERLIHAALDLGVTLLDTARSYGASEERIGRALRGRRARAVLSTKVGYGVEGAADWTPESVRRGIDEALAKLETDWIDIVHLHSCPEELVRAGEITGVLTSAAREGKIRVAAYWDRGRALSLPGFGLAPEALALRFAAFTWGIDCAIAGTTSLDHLAALAGHVADGPLPGEVTAAVRDAWRRVGADWPGVV